MSGGDRRRRAGGEIAGKLKGVMRLFPQGVTVVTTQTKRGPVGLTVSSFTSVSLDPPLVLVSIGKASDVHGSLVRTGHFAVNLLASDQKRISERFAGRLDSKQRFEGVNFYAGTTGSPLIRGALAAIECSVWRVYEGGDHSLVLGEVTSASAMANKKPLVYHMQEYTTTA
ncbi:MAG TPA: flavin reductase family protein [Nitrososphaerales archaeon]|nr:flavin reductase family protein [Nitrososphaerales archaeon]